MKIEFLRVNICIFFCRDGGYSQRGYEMPERGSGEGLMGSYNGGGRLGTGGGSAYDTFGSRLSRGGMGAGMGGGFRGARGRPSYF